MYRLIDKSYSLVSSSKPLYSCNECQLYNLSHLLADLSLSVARSFCKGGAELSTFDLRASLLHTVVVLKIRRDADELAHQVVTIKNIGGCSLQLAACAMTARCT